MNYYALLPLTAFSANVILGCYVLYKNPKGRLSIFYSLFTFSLVIWALGSLLAFTSSTSEAALYWNKLTVVGPSIMPAFLLHFFLIFTKKEFILRKIFYIPLYLPALFFISAGLTTNLISESTELAYWGYSYRTGTLYPLLALYVIGYFIIGILFCYRYYLKTQPVKEKIQAKFLIIAITIPLVGGTITEVIPKLIGFEMIPLSTLFITIGAVIIAYTIIKHQLMTPMSFSIQRKLVAGFLVVALLVGVVGYISVDISQRALQESIGENSIMLAQQTIDKIDRTIYYRIEEMLSYASDNLLAEEASASNEEFDNIADIQDYIDEIDKDWIEKKDTLFIQSILNNELSKTLSKHLEFYEHRHGYAVLAEAYVTNKYGVIIASTGRTSDYLQADEEWYQTAVKEKEFWVGEVEYDESSDTFACDIVINLYDNNGNLVGIFKGVLNIEEVIDIIKEIEQTGIREEHEAMRHKTMHFDLINKDGKLIYSTDEFTFFEDASDELLLHFMVGEHIHYAIIRNHSYCEGEEILAAHANSIGYKDYKGLGWVLVLGLDTEEIFVPVYELRNFIIIISSIVTIFSIIIGIFISRSFSKPIIKLRNVASEIGKGNLNAKIEVKSNDEVGELAAAFSQMIKDLKKSKEEIEKYSETLEKQVQERTKDLNAKVDDLEKSELASLNIMEDLQEITEELEESKEMIEQKNIELEKLNTLKSAFLNITSHELRTPMSSIKGYIQMLLKQKLGEVNKDQRSALEVVLRNADRLDRLIQDILDVSRLESGTMKFIQENTVVGRMVEEIAETMQPSASLKDIKLNTEIGKGIPDLFIDPERIKQVVINLTNNAIKFSPNSSSVNIRVRKENDDVLFEVEDFGRGIPKDKQDKVFETFYQVDSGADTKFGGAGLGLAISRGIVIAHGGKIWVESEGMPGKGSTFRFTLPVKSVKDIEERFKGVDIFRLEKEKDADENKNET